MNTSVLGFVGNNLYLSGLSAGRTKISILMSRISEASAEGEGEAVSDGGALGAKSLRKTAKSYLRFCS